MQPNEYIKEDIWHAKWNASVMINVNSMQLIIIPVFVLTIEFVSVDVDKPNCILNC